MSAAISPVDFCSFKSALSSALKQFVRDDQTLGAETLTDAGTQTLKHSNKCHKAQPSGEFQKVKPSSDSVSVPIGVTHS